LSEKKCGKHPTQKPIGLMKHFINLLTNENDVVLDPFMGSGSSGVAASQLNRKFIGIELSQEYFSIAKQRIDVK
jgi:site-specific DNA-methyltransferase (adenine-specific)